MLELLSPSKNSSVSLQTSAQKNFINEEERRAKTSGDLTFRWYDLEKEGTDRTIPLPVSFTWRDTAETEENESYHYLLISEKEDMSNALVYITKDFSYDVYNLKVDTTYFWCIQKNGRRSEIYNFSTLLTLPRCLRIKGISNVRDIGGYSVNNGKIRQGLVYRGGEFELHMQLSPEGATDLHRLGIRTELDMRGEAEEKIDFTTAQAIGINRIFVPFVPYQEVFDMEYRNCVVNFFKAFTQRNNYPIYFHCWGGADRTGTAAFILEALLGMNYEDLVYEYEFTSLSFWGTRTRNYCNFIEFINQFKRLEGINLQEKARNFLKIYSGLTDNEIDEIQNILIEIN